MKRTLRRTLGKRVRLYGGCMHILEPGEALGLWLPSWKDVVSVMGFYSKKYLHTY